MDVVVLISSSYFLSYVLGQKTEKMGRHPQKQPKVFDTSGGLIPSALDLFHSFLPFSPSRDGHGRLHRVCFWMNSSQKLLLAFICFLPFNPWVFISSSMFLKGVKAWLATGCPFKVDPLCCIVGGTSLACVEHSTSPPSLTSLTFTLEKLFFPYVAAGECKKRGKGEMQNKVEGREKKAIKIKKKQLTTLEVKSDLNPQQRILGNSRPLCMFSALSARLTHGQGV